MTAILKVDTIQDTSGNNIINENAGTITIGKSGDTVNLASGATAGFGKVLQVVQTVKQDMTSTSSTSYVDISGMSVSITPSSASSKILILCTANTSTNNTDAQGKLLRDSTDIVGTGATNNATMYLRSSNGDTMSPNGIIYLDSPNTTSAVTYKLQWRVVTDTVYLNRRMGDTAFGTISTIIAMEISA